MTKTTKRKASEAARVLRNPCSTPKEKSKAAKELSKRRRSR